MLLSAMFDLELILLLFFTLLLTMIKCTAGAVAAPTNVRISAITCTSVRVCWDGVNGATQYRMDWMLINSPSRMIGSRTASASITSQTLTGLSQFSQYTVEVTSLVNGRRGDISPPVTFTVNCPSDNNNINNRIPAPSNVRISEVTTSSAVVTWDRVDNVNEYQVEWRILDGGVTMTTDVMGGINNTTLRDLEPNRQYGVSISVLNNGVVVNTSTEVTFLTDSTSTNSTEQIEQVNHTDPTDLTNLADPVNLTNLTDPVNLTNLTDPVNLTSLADPVNLTNFTTYLTNSTDPMIVICNGTVPVAPMNLTARIISSQMLMVSWTYPPSLLAQTMFEVTYNLVSAYNTSDGMKSFAEYDKFNTTETSFHFALVSSVTNYIFTVTPYSATRAGDSARVLVDDFSAVDLVEDPVIFFNLRFSGATNSLSLSNDEINLELTERIQSSISDMCQCTLPSYTLRGSMESCDSLSNCAIYTGRLLGSDTASATEVFEMVGDWLATQNGSLLNGTLSIDPDCPLQRLSPNDAVCSYPNITSDNTTGGSESPVEENEASSGTDGLKMLAVGFASGFAIIICAVLICTGVYKSSKLIKRKKTDALTHIESEERLTPFLQTPFQQTADVQRHYSVVVERNPSYNRHHNNVIKPCIISNDRQLEASSSDTENPYSYTSLKSAQRQAEALGFRQQPQQQDDGITRVTIEQSVSGSYTNEYVVESLTSSGYYFNEQYTATEFHPSSTPNGHGAYLSVS